MAAKGIVDVQRQDGIPRVAYSEVVNVKIFFDDKLSTLARLAMYRSASVRNVAFWKLGQEDRGMWGGIAIAPLGAPLRAPFKSARGFAFPPL
jgi:spore germination protein YaaH